MDEEGFGQLPLQERWNHKLWKARQHGYEEATKTFKSALGPEDPSLAVFRDGALLKQAVTDSNAVSLEKGIKAVIAYVEIADVRDIERLRTAALRDLAEKGLSAVKPGTKTAALEALLAFVEAAEQPVQCIELMLPLLSDKRPKMVLAVANALATIYTEFGAKAVDPTPVLKALPKLFESPDAKVRAEATRLAVVLSWYVTPAVVEQVLAPAIKPIALKDVKDKMDKTAKVPAERTLRIHANASAGEPEVADTPMEYEVEAAAAGIDPWTLAEPKEVLGKLPENFEGAQASPKFLERIEPLKQLAALLNTPRLAPGDYLPLLQFLVGRLQKEKHFQCQDQLVTCVRLMVEGLRTAFPGSRGELVPVLLDRLKEKKVAENVHNTLQAIFGYWPLQDYWDHVQAAMENKTPTMRVEATRVAVKYFQETAEMPPPAFAAQVAAAAAKSVNDTNEQVRSQGVVLLATLSKMFGDRVTLSAVEGLDDLKKKKIEHAKQEVTFKAKANVSIAAPRPAGRPAGARPAAGKAPARPAGGAGSGASSGAPGATRQVRVTRPVPRGAAPPSPRVAAKAAPGAASGAGASAGARAGSPKRMQETPVKTKNARTSYTMQWTPSRDPTPARRRMESPLRTRASMAPPDPLDEMEDVPDEHSSNWDGPAGPAGQQANEESRLLREENQMLRLRLDAEIARRTAAETATGDAQQQLATVQQQLADSRQQVSALRRRNELLQRDTQSPAQTDVDAVNHGINRMSLDAGDDRLQEGRSPARSPSRSMIQLGVPRTPGSRPAAAARPPATSREDSWSRAAEVSNELRKRIEAMKRQRGAV